MPASVSAQHQPLELSHGYWCEPAHGLPPCGDAALLVQAITGWWFVALDAIGHGSTAQRIADRVLSLLQSRLSDDPTAAPDPESLLQYLHQQLIQRRCDEQAAIALFHFLPGNWSLEALLVGNLDAFLFRSGQRLRLTAHHGMVGGRLPTRLSSTRLDLSPESLLAIFSDGMRVREAAAVLPRALYDAEASRSLHALARSLVSEHRRLYDDSSCALVRLRSLKHG